MTATSRHPGSRVPLLLATAAVLLMLVFPFVSATHHGWRARVESAKFRDPDADVRKRAAGVMLLLGPAAVPAIIEQTGDPDPMVRSRIMQALRANAAFAMPATTAEILAYDNHLLVDPVNPTIAAFISQLRVLGDAGEAPFRAALDHEHLEVRRAAALLLFRKERLDRLRPRQRVGAYIPGLAEALGDALPVWMHACRVAMDDDDPAIQMSAARALGTIGAPAVPVLVEAMAARRVHTVSNAIYAMGEGHAKRPLIELLAHEDAAMRRAAVRLLGLLTMPRAGQRRTDDPVARPDVVAALSAAVDDADASVRRAAVSSLRQMGRAAADAVPTLAAHLRSDPDRSIRAACAVVIGGIRSQSEIAVPALVAALEDPRSEVRFAAGKSLVGLGGAAVGPVAALIADDPGGSGPAADILRRMGRRALRSLEGLLAHDEAEARVIAAHTLGLIGPDAGPSRWALIDALADDEASVRAAVADAIARIGADVESIPALMTALDRDDVTAVYLAIALGRLGADAEPAVPLLQRALRSADDAVRAEAARALAEIGDTRAADALAAAIDDDHWEVRWEVARALTRLEPATADRVLARAPAPRVRRILERARSIRDLTVVIGRGPVQRGVAATLHRLDGLGGDHRQTRIELTPYRMKATAAGLFVMSRNRLERFDADGGSTTIASDLSATDFAPVPGGGWIIADAETDEISLYDRLGSAEPATRNWAIMKTQGPGRRRMQVAVTTDGYIVFGAQDPVGVYRFPLDGASLPPRLLNHEGGVAADPVSDRWAVCGKKLRILEPGREVLELSFPPGRTPPLVKLVTFAPGGSPIVVLKTPYGLEIAIVDEAELAFRTLFRWPSGVLSIAVEMPSEALSEIAAGEDEAGDREDHGLEDQ